MCDVGCHPSMTDVQVKLHNEDIWHEFHEHTTEMIITKTGRRMFPYLRLEITGLEPDARYFILLEFNLSSNKRFKFNGAQWIALGNAEPQFSSSSRLYAHPDSPAVGRHWMSQSVLFNKVKLTNHTFDLNGNVVLTSMHKYLPCVHVVMASDVLAVRWSPTATFAFKETEFIAVTAYQNEKITKLKIDNNPFAKGFRETGHSRFKRKLSHIKDEVDKDEKSVQPPPPPPPPPPQPPLTLPQLQIMALQADDSGISSTGSVTPPVSDNEDILRPNSINNWLNERLQQNHHYNYLSHQSHHQPTLHHPSWMDLPLPPYPVIPPYCPTLWPYSPLFLPPMPPPHIYSHSLQLPLPYLPVTPNPSSEPCLIDLSIRKDN